MCDMKCLNNKKRTSPTLHVTIVRMVDSAARTNVLATAPKNMQAYTQPFGSLHQTMVHIYIMCCLPANLVIRRLPFANAMESFRNLILCFAEVAVEACY